MFSPDLALTSGPGSDRFRPLGAMLPCPEIFLVVTTADEKMLLTSSGQRPGMLLASYSTQDSPLVKESRSPECHQCRGEKACLRPLK